jgi:lysophospholipase L1-like esterase
VPRRLLVLAIMPLAVALACGIPTVSAGSAAASTATSQSAAKQYYLALGDSLAAGYQPNHRGGQGYTNQLDARLRSSHGRVLSLEDLACSGETTWTLIHGGICTYPGESGAGAQLQAALDFLRAHRGHVPLITINIGGNDLNPCDGDTSVSAADACGESLIPEMSRNLTSVLKALRAADPSAVITGLNYYVPYLADWLNGAGGRAYAIAQLAVVRVMNAALAADYKAARAFYANVFSRFKGGDLTGKSKLPGHGTVPVAVALACEWTWMCAPAPEGGDEHPDKDGYGAIAAAITAVLPASITR